MCALVMQSPKTAKLTEKVNVWTLRDRLRWKAECFLQKLQGGV